MDSVVPPFWIDHDGKQQKTPVIKKRLKYGKIPLHRALRKFVFIRDGFRCQWCGVSPDYPIDPATFAGDPPFVHGRQDILVADHVVSRKNGGSHHPSNLQTLCGSCNSCKANSVDAPAVAARLLQNDGMRSC